MSPCRPTARRPCKTSNASSPSRSSPASPAADCWSANGFAATVDPSEGLSAIKGYQAAWTGTGVLNNGTPVDFVVMVHGVDGPDPIVLDLMIENRAVDSAPRRHVAERVTITRGGSLRRKREQENI